VLFTKVSARATGSVGAIDTEGELKGGENEGLPLREGVS